jgi:hypothetical protein
MMEDGDNQVANRKARLYLQWRFCLCPCALRPTPHVLPFTLLFLFIYYLFILASSITNTNIHRFH